MATHLTRQQSPREFLQKAEAFLTAHEAAHNMILGLASNLMAGMTYGAEPPYFATAERGGVVVGGALRTPPFGLVLSLMDADVVPTFAADAHALYPDLPSTHGPSDVSHAFALAWQRLSGRRYAQATQQRIYQLTRVTPVTGVPGKLRRATHSDRDLILLWNRGFIEETVGVADSAADNRALAMLGNDADKALYIWHDGRPVAMAGYSSPTPNGIRVSYVYTPPELRGRGYASAATAAVSQLQLDAGRKFCFLYTDRRNPVSNRIYRRIGYEPVVDGDEYVFEPRS